MNISNRCIYLGNYIFDTSRLNTIISQQQLLTIALILRSIIQKQSTVDIINEAWRIYQNLINNGFESIYTTNFNLGLDMELPTFHDILFALSRIGLVEDLDEENIKLQNYEVMLTSEENNDANN
ncbi:MAG: hypothetical protein HFE30_01090 [Clostridiales bacterium]|nr:hypothetical protein [Clostridiales bacterium]